ncbi:MAG: tryptophan-rich sensory protein [Lachnospiraceae bacterium]|nr:tryptophan-rich sensory protein [Lachnospiraceae bacterium]
MKINKKALIIAIAIPLLVGAVSAFISSNSMEQFGQLNKPPLAPPGFLFPIVWTILYTLMGIASYLVFSSNQKQEDINDALTVYALQLAVNFFWSIFFFNLEWYLFSFFWLILLWVLILYTILLFYQISKPAAYLMVPYLLWVTFAGYLNLGIYVLN